MGDEDLYQVALQEFERGDADEGLLAKAWVNANGDEARKKIEYVKLRVSQLKGARIKRAAAVVAPSMWGLVSWLLKVAALLLLASIGMALLGELEPRQVSAAPGNSDVASIAGSVLGGIVAIYLISRLTEWAILKRVIQNRTLMIVWSTFAAYLCMFILVYSAIGKPYAVHPILLAHYLLSSILLVLGRTFLPGSK